MLLTRLRKVARLRAAARHYQVSPVAVGGRFLWLRAVRGMGFEEALSKGLLDPRMPAAKAASFARDDELLRTLRAFNPEPTDLVDDKAIFYGRCRGQGIPIPRMHAVVSPPLGVTGEGRVLGSAESWRHFLCEELPAEFVVKPALGLHGKRVEVFERRGDGFLCGASRLSADELQRRLCSDGAYGRAVVQERLRNDPALRELSGTESLQCTRIVTVVTKTGEVEIPHACQKLIAGRNQTDNFGGGASGNLVASMDVSTGVLGPAFGAGREGVGLSVHDSHPDTGRRIPAFQLPHWAEARALVRLAAAHTLPLRSIGWDVALTPRGPVIVEGNTLWFCAAERGFWHDLDSLARLRAAL